MRLLTPIKMTFVGPDPPMVRVELDQAELEQKEKEAAAMKKKGAAVEELNLEPEKSPEEEAEDLMFINFVDDFADKIV